MFSKKKIIFSVISIFTLFNIFITNKYYNINEIDDYLINNTIDKITFYKDEQELMFTFNNKYDKCYFNLYDTCIISNSFNIYPRGLGGFQLTARA